MQFILYSLAFDGISLCSHVIWNSADWQMVHLVNFGLGRRECDGDEVDVATEALVFLAIGLSPLISRACCSFFVVGRQS